MHSVSSWTKPLTEATSDLDKTERIEINYAIHYCIIASFGKHPNDCASINTQSHRCQWDRFDVVGFKT